MLGMALERTWDACLLQLHALQALYLGEQDQLSVRSKRGVYGCEHLGPTLLASLAATAALPAGARAACVTQARNMRPSRMHDA